MLTFVKKEKRCEKKMSYVFDSKKVAQEYDDCKVELKTVMKRAGELRKIIRNLTPGFTKSLEKINNGEEYTEVGKQGNSVSKPVILTSAHVAQLTRKRKRKTLSMTTLPKGFDSYFETNSSVTPSTVDPFLVHLKGYLATSGGFETNITYRRQHKSEFPQDDDTPEPPTKRLKKKAIPADSDGDDTESDNDETNAAPLVL